MHYEIRERRETNRLLIKPLPDQYPRKTLRQWGEMFYEDR